MKLTAITPIKHGGKRIDPGTGFDADKKAADQLLKLGAAVEAAKAPPAPAPVQAPVQGDVPPAQPPLLP